MTEAMSCKDDDVYVVGAGNSAGQAALYFSQYARRVVMLVRGESLEAKMSQYLVDRLRTTPNVEVRLNAEITACRGSEHLEGITLADRKEGTSEEVPARFVFVFIGAAPRTDWLKGTVALDRQGFVLTGPDLGPDDLADWPFERQPYLLEASVPGIFAAGDVRHESVKRVASAVGEGSVAVHFMHRYRASL
jgi:thioredoxin reductase (NADPH)